MRLPRWVLGIGLLIALPAPYAGAEEPEKETGAPNADAPAEGVEIRRYESAPPIEAPSPLPAPVRQVRLEIGKGGVVTGQNAVDWILTNPEAKAFSAALQKVSRGQAVRANEVRWPLPAEATTIRLTSADVDAFDRETGLLLRQLDRSIQQFGGYFDVETFKRVLDHADLKRVNDREFEIEIVLNPQHCKLTRLEDPTCEKDRVYIPAQNDRAFARLMAEHERLRNPTVAATDAPCAPSQNELSDIAPAVAKLATPETPASAESVRRLLDRFRDMGPTVQLQTVELDPTVRMKITLGADADGDATATVNGFKGIEAHLQIPKVSNQLQPRFQFLGGLLDSFTQGAMNGTFEASPVEAFTSKGENKAKVSGLLGAARIGYSDRTGLEVMGMNQDSPIIRYLNQQFQGLGRR